MPGWPPALGGVGHHLHRAQASFEQFEFSSTARPSPSMRAPAGPGCGRSQVHRRRPRRTPEGRGGRGARGGGGVGRGGVGNAVSRRREAARLHSRLELWVRDVATSQERQLTTMASRTSATPPTTPGGRPAIERSSSGPRLEEDRDLSAGRAQRWRHVSRGHPGRHPALRAWKYPLPGTASCDAPARHHRRGRRARRAVPDAADYHRATSVTTSV